LTEIVTPSVAKYSHAMALEGSVGKAKDATMIRPGEEAAARKAARSSGDESREGGGPPPGGGARRTKRRPKAAAKRPGQKGREKK